MSALHVYANQLDVSHITPGTHCYTAGCNTVKKYIEELVSLRFLKPNLEYQIYNI